MELTVNIKEQNKLAAFLDLIKDIDYIEIIDVKEEGELPEEHRVLLDKRLHKTDNSESSFKNWDLLKKKYEGKAV